MATQPIMFFDIETVANEESFPLMPEPSAPGNYKDLEKIAAYKEEQMLKQMASAALDPDFGKIVALGWQMSLTGKPESFLVGQDGSEEDLLRHFWATLNSGKCCGYNIIGFDFPFILRRCFELKVAVPQRVNLSKYQMDPIIDLMGIFYNWNTQQTRGLKFVCQRYGIPNQYPELNGSHVAEMDPTVLRSYVTSDVLLTVQLYLKMLGIYIPMTA